MNLIIFDIDDTLTQSEKQHQQAFVAAMKKMGIAKINQNWKEYEHITDSHILKVNYKNHFQSSFSKSLIPDFEEDMVNFINKLNPSKEIKGSQKLMKQLHNNKNFVFAFATGSLHRPALLKLQQAGIACDKNLIASSNQIFERENIVRAAIEKAKNHHQITDFKNIISVGDGIWDLKTAKKLGIHFLGIGTKNVRDFKENGLKYHINDWENFDLSLFEQMIEN